MSDAPLKKKKSIFPEGTILNFMRNTVWRTRSVQCWLQASKMGFHCLGTWIILFTTTSSL